MRTRTLIGVVVVGGALALCILRPSATGQTATEMYPPIKVGKIEMQVGNKILVLNDEVPQLTTRLTALENANNLLRADLVKLQKDTPVLIDASMSELRKNYQLHYNTGFTPAGAQVTQFTMPRPYRHAKILAMLKPQNAAHRHRMAYITWTPPAQPTIAFFNQSHLPGGDAGMYQLDLLVGVNPASNRPMLTIKNLAGNAGPQAVDTSCDFYEQF